MSHKLSQLSLFPSAEVHISHSVKQKTTGSLDTHPRGFTRSAHHVGLPPTTQLPRQHMALAPEAARVHCVCPGSGEGPGITVSCWPYSGSLSPVLLKRQKMGLNYRAPRLGPGNSLLRAERGRCTADEWGSQASGLRKADTGQAEALPTTASNSPNSKVNSSNS